MWLGYPECRLDRCARRPFFIPGYCTRWLAVVVSLTVVQFWGGALAKVEGVEFSLAKELNEWVQKNTKSRRLGISKVMDGRAISCCDVPDSELCDVCEPDSTFSRYTVRFSKKHTQYVDYVKGEKKVAKLAVAMRTKTPTATHGHYGWFTSPEASQGRGV